MTKQLNRWQIECAHTPETIDRVLMPIRKRGICVESFSYQKTNEESAVCTIEFEMEGADLDRVYKNMLRIYDIQTITKL